jgi:hypothetical protein
MGARHCFPFLGVMVAGALSACAPSSQGGGGLADLQKTLGDGIASASALPQAPADSPTIKKIGTNATIKIYLLSNKDKTQFSINDNKEPLSETKSLTVFVPATGIRIVAIAPGYCSLTQEANAGNYDNASLFQFTFGNWDLKPACEKDRQ